MGKVETQLKVKVEIPGKPCSSVLLSKCVVDVPCGLSCYSSLPGHFLNHYDWVDPSMITEEQNNYEYYGNKGLISGNRLCPKVEVQGSECLQGTVGQEGVTNMQRSTCWGHHCCNILLYRYPQSGRGSHSAFQISHQLLFGCL